MVANQHSWHRPRHVLYVRNRLLSKAIRCDWACLSRMIRLISRKGRDLKDKTDWVKQRTKQKPEVDLLQSLLVVFSFQRDSLRVAIALVLPQLGVASCF